MHKTERRSRASTSHLVSTEDEFLMPAQFDPALNDLYASDDEDIEVYPRLRLPLSLLSLFCVLAFTTLSDVRACLSLYV